MIIVRSPMRISLGGGGTDLPSYYREHGGFCIAAAIDRFVFISLHETFEQEIVVKYSKMERVKTVDEVQHPIVKAALKMHGIANPHIEIASYADIPAGTGLGSSSSFTVALLKALQVYEHKNGIDALTLATRACRIELRSEERRGG